MLGGWATFAGFAVVFGFYFGAEAWLRASGLGATTSASEGALGQGGERDVLAGQLPLLLYAVLQILAVPTVLWLTARRPLATFEIVGTILSLGAMAGSVGGLAGHEFMHRRTRWERILGLAVYGTVNYAHFRISHIGGHHRNVGLYEDWSTARRGESLYAFLLRAVFAGLRGAFRLEAERLEARGHSAWSPRNFVVRYGLFECALWTAVFVVLGARAALVFGLGSALAIVLMETVNYMSHYGLTRTRGANGRPEPIGNEHSWESNNKATNWFIFNAGMHCHHHRHPSHPHDRLTLCHEKAYLPHGLPLMTLIALVPPLFFRKMDPRVDMLRREVQP